MHKKEIRSVCFYLSAFLSLEPVSVLLWFLFSSYWGLGGRIRSSSTSVQPLAGLSFPSFSGLIFSGQTLTELGQRLLIHRETKRKVNERQQSCLRVDGNYEHAHTHTCCAFPRMA